MSKTGWGEDLLAVVSSMGVAMTSVIGFILMAAIVFFFLIQSVYLYRGARAEKQKPAAKKHGKRKS